MNKRKEISLLFILFLSLISCRKDKPVDKINANINISENAVIISNEGNFQFGNAGISLYNPAENSITEDIFAPANNHPLGDVCQSIFFFNGKAYVVVNNSGKIEVVNENTFVSTATITGFTSPRYILPVSNAKAYVSDLYANKIYIVNLSTNNISGSININGWCEEMTMIYGKVFVTSQETNKLYVIDASSDNLIDSITIGYASNSIVQDKEGKIWTLCSGNESLNIYPTLHKINPISLLVEQTFQFQNSIDSPWRLKINGNLDTLYFLNNGVYRMPISGTVIPSQAFITQSGNTFYGLGVNPTNSEVYISDAIDYVQKGIVYRYKSNGVVITSFKAGIIPGDFYFK